MGLPPLATYLPLGLCLVLSTSFQPVPGLGVGGRGLPWTAVTSLPPPTGRYCPELGAGVPGLIFFVAIFDHLPFKLDTGLKSRGLLEEADSM